MEMELKDWMSDELADWVEAEEPYVQAKFGHPGDPQRDQHDATFTEYDLSAFWERQIVQYLDRAKVFLTSARGVAPQHRRQFELLACQALAKGMMTFKGCVESAIRVYGAMPEAGHPSGEIVLTDKPKIEPKPATKSEAGR